MNTPVLDKQGEQVLLEKWGTILDYKSDKMAPIENRRERLNTAILLENQEEWCLREANTTQSGGVFGAGGSVYPANYQVTRGLNGANDDSYATGDARLPKILIPMVRRTFPELVTNEIVGVQPMTGPVGLAFALRYKYAGSSATLNGSVGPAGAAVYDAASANTTGSGNTATGELGYQHLDSRFTGISSTELTGVSAGSETTQNAWTNGTGFNAVDQGIAAAVNAFEDSGAIPTVELSFEKTAVEAGTRRLGAKWSIELEQDLKNMNGIDVDAELTNATSYELQAEIDREMVIRMIQTALRAGNPAGFTIWSASAADARWLGERNRNFYQKLVVEANRMAVRNRRGPANFIVATPRVCSILEMLDEFQWMPQSTSVNTQPVGVAKVGTVGGRFNVYRDTRTEAIYNEGAAESARIEYALLGYKGPEYYDTGIVYCPYIPVMIQRAIDPNAFTPRVGMLTRYGVIDNLFGSELYYHIVFVSGLGEAFTPGERSTYL